LSRQQNEIIVDLTVAGNKDKAVRFAVNVVTSGKDKRSKLFGRCGGIKIEDLRVSSNVGSERRIIPVEKIDLDRSLGSQGSIDDGDKTFVGHLEIIFMSSQ